MAYVPHVVARRYSFERAGWDIRLDRSGDRAEHTSSGSVDPREHSGGVSGSRVDVDLHTVRSARLAKAFARERSSADFAPELERELRLFRRRFR